LTAARGPLLLQRPDLLQGQQVDEVGAEGISSGTSAAISEHEVDGFRRGRPGQHDVVRHGADGMAAPRNSSSMRTGTLAGQGPLAPAGGQDEMQRAVERAGVPVPRA
jgi:hypothetical protein